MVIYVQTNDDNVIEAYCTSAAYGFDRCLVPDDFDIDAGKWIVKDGVATLQPNVDPTPMDILEAQVMYTAMMTDTLLEE